MQVSQLERVRGSGKRIIRATAKFLVKQYVSNNWTRHCYVFAKGISTKIVLPVLPILHELIFEKLKLYLRKQYLHRDRSSCNPISESLYQIATSVPADFNPKISVIVPSAYDAESLRQRLNSIYQQTFSNFEVILLDDGLRDESRVILEEYFRRYPEITRCAFEKDSAITPQWMWGLQLARGDLIWIAESDDYCSRNLLAELVKYFVNEAVMLAFCKSEFAEGEFAEPIASCKEYPGGPNFELECDQFVTSAHSLVNKAWSIKSNVPKIGSTIFRHPGKMELLNNRNWQRMKICGDWIFYLHLIRGGLVAYSPHVTNYFRLHQHDASQDALSASCFYEEHEEVAKALITLYQVETQVVVSQRRRLSPLLDTLGTDCSEDLFKKQRKPNLLMASFALTAGGGETFPIKLANILKTAGYGITFLNCHKAPTEIGIRQLLLPTIPLLELDTLSKLGAVVDNMGIELVHSHHSWVDVCASYFLEDHPKVQLVVTSHGIYEMTPPPVLAQIFPLLRKRVNKFVYLTDKNLPVFKSHQFDTNRFVKIGNALDIIPITPIPRQTIGVPEEAFLICLVSRAIPEKGWTEAIETVKLARGITQKDIHLLLVGAGPEYERLKPIIKDPFVHLLGFRANVRDYFATSDLGFLPSRYLGESFPLVLIECLHAHRPVLASKLGEIENMLSTSKGHAGTVFDLNDSNIPVAHVAQLIAEYVENTELYRDHLHQVPEAVSKFDPITLLEKYEEVYLDLIKKE
jgi:glycosyltransferase involved in cell wall biosynthesis